MNVFRIWSQSLMLGIALWLYLLLFLWLCWHWGLKRPSVPTVYYERWLESWFGGESFIIHRYWALQGSAFRDLVVKARFILYSNDHKAQTLSNPEKCCRNIQCLHHHKHVLDCTQRIKCGFTTNTGQPRLFCFLFQLQGKGSAQRHERKKNQVDQQFCI